MTNNSSGGSVILRGVEVGLDTDVGHGFVVDCCRYCEKLVTEDEIRAKYSLNTDAWAQLADNQPVQQVVKQQRERRVRSGEAAKERAQYLFVQAPTVLGEILN